MTLLNDLSGEAARAADKLDDMMNMLDHYNMGVAGASTVHAERDPESPVVDNLDELVSMLHDAMDAVGKAYELVDDVAARATELQQGALYR